MKKLIGLLALVVALSGFTLCDNVTVAFGSASASYTDLITITPKTTEVWVKNGYDTNVMLSIDNGTTDHFEVHAGDALNIPIKQGLEGGTTIDYKYVSNPSSGNLTAGCVGY